MATLIILAFIGAVLLESWVFVRCMCLGPRSPGCWLCLGFVVAAAVGSYHSTFHFEHWPNENTRIVGVPVPQVVFQRDTPEGAWRDYVGPTLILAWPMNFIVFSFLPALLLLAFTWLWGRMKKRRGAKGEKRTLSGTTVGTRRNEKEKGSLWAEPANRQQSAPSLPPHDCDRQQCPHSSDPE